MKKLSIIAAFLLVAMLFSCRQIEKEYQDSTDSTAFSDETTSETDAAGTNENTDTEPEVELPCLIGFYDDLENNGNYTRLTEWNDPWIIGKDIAVFDVIPSNENTLSSNSYKDLWIAESEKISNQQLVKPRFFIEYTMTDGSVNSREINSYKDAEAITDEGLIEVYLYDDVHQDGGWYYHLTEDTVNDDTVISSIKLTAGKDIEKVASILLTAYIEGSSPAVININNGNS